METQKSLTIEQESISKIVTYAIFFLMVFWNFSIYFLTQWIWNATFPFWAKISSSCIQFGLISLVIWLNRDNLQKLNIDRTFFVIFIVGWLFISLYLPFPIGILLALLVLIFGISSLKSGVLKFANTVHNYWLVLILLALLLAPKFLYTAMHGRSIAWLDILAVVNAIFIADIPQIVIEEIVFRGMLWMFLMNLNLKDYQIIFIQALIFWLGHSFYSSNFLIFWVFLPFESLIYGIIVWRTKTIGTSAVGHFLSNFIAGLVR